MSYGQQLLREYLLALYPHKMVENYRPEWLHGLEIDFWFPDYNIAIEFQGGQHYVPRDGDIAGLYRQKHNDGRKARTLKMLGIQLIRIDAIHLGRAALLGRIRAVIRHHRRALGLARNYATPFPSHKCKTKGLDRRAVQYRRLLREQYNCPTARRRGHAPRKRAAKARWDLARAQCQFTPPTPNAPTLTPARPSGSLSVP